MGDTAKALADYDRALKLQDTLASAYFARGAFYKRHGAYPRAIEDFSHGLATDTTNFQAYLGRGEAYDALEQIDSALVDYSRAIRLQPTDARAHLARGDLYDRKTLYDSAAADFRLVLRTFTDPKDSVLAAARLRGLGPHLRPDSTAVAAASVVYLHFADPADRLRVEQVARTLAAKAYKVEGVERREEPTTGDVRYFYREDLRKATQLGSDVELALAEQGIRVKLRVLAVLTMASRNVPQGQLEVWLPPLRSPSGAQAY